MSKPWEETWDALGPTIFADDGDAIAKVYEHMDVIQDADHSARARMMAAAPELYRALESAIHAMRASAWSFNDPRLDNEIDEAVEVLKKARGE